MHQRAVFLPSGDMLMYGGRTSPGKANSDCFLFSSCSDKVVVKKLPLAPGIPGRWRHSMTHLSVNGEDNNYEKLIFIISCVLTYTVHVP